MPSKNGFYYKERIKNSHLQYIDTSRNIFIYISRNTIFNYFVIQIFQN